MKTPILRFGLTATVLLVLSGLTWLMTADRRQVRRDEVLVPKATLVSGVHTDMSTRALDGSSEAAVEVVAPTRNWLREFHESADHFSLAQDLAGAASGGDARAEYTLGQLLLKCESHRRSLLPYAEGSVRQRVEAYLASEGVRSTENARQRFRTEALRCERLFSQNPFEQTDLPKAAFDFRYWAERALASGDPLATMNRAIRFVVSRGSDAESDRTFRESLVADLRTAIFSRDAAALFAVAGVLSHPSITDSPESGFAWYIAACESGHDCSNSNPDLGLGCIDSGTCEAGQTYLDVLQRDLGAAKYAEIYANAQDIQYKVRSNDWDGLQQYLKIK